MWLGSGHKTSPVRRGSFGNILKVPSLYWMYDVNGQKCFISVSFWCWYLEMINYSLMVWGISTIFAHIPAWHWAARAESRSIPMSRIFRGGLALTLIPWSKPILNLQSKTCIKRVWKWAPIYYQIWHSNEMYQSWIRMWTMVWALFWKLCMFQDVGFRPGVMGYFDNRTWQSNSHVQGILYIHQIHSQIISFKKADFSMVLIFVVFVQFSQ